MSLAMATPGPGDLAGIEAGSRGGLGRNGADLLARGGFARSNKWKGHHRAT